LVEIICTVKNPVLLKIISPLIVQDVHNRDVVQNLQKKKIKDPIDFQWLSQLRMNYSVNQETNIKTIYANCLQTKYPYG